MSDRGRGRFHRDYPPRSEEKSHHGRNSAPPSRHLWIGNLPHDITESTLAHHLLQFGELESIAFQPGRSYAFVNYKHEEDAFAAIRELQGFIFAGNALRVEFAKADKSSTQSHNEDYLHYREEGPILRAPPFAQRDGRLRHSSPDPSYPDKSKMSDKNVESPSEVLWIGFPALLKVDEFILRRAFSPFGEIEKITAFPGRSYAFVRFKNVMAACRAKETLQGKLFGNPRVHICFAKNETGPSKSGRSSMNAPSPPHLKSYNRGGSSETFRQDRNFGKFVGDTAVQSPFISNLEPEDPNVMRFGRKHNLWEDVGDAFEQRGFQESDTDILAGNMYVPHGSPARDRGPPFHEMSPQQFPRNGPLYDDSWDLPEDTLPFRGAKKHKPSPFPTDNELPEYPLSGPDQTKHVFPSVFSDFRQPEALVRNFEHGQFGYKEVPDRALTLTELRRERSDLQSSSNGRSRPGTLPSNPVDGKRLNPESQRPPLTEEWKWEGTIAKGGTPVCRARCFPVGKALDVMLPEFLDCTARTGLEMLAKHYYQAANAWVIFFVPESDADIGFYNEFMHYLGEKQRAAVAKLDERTTLFLVPPSEFSEKVLKVPGKMSISGVILRLEPPGSKSGLSLHHPHDIRDTDTMSFHGDASYSKPTSPSEPLTSMQSFTNQGRYNVNDTSVRGNFSKFAASPSSGDSVHSVGITSTSTTERRHDFMLHSQNLSYESNWSPHPAQNLNLGIRNLASQTFDGTSEHASQGFNAGNPRTIQESSNSHTTGVSGMPLLAGSSKLSRQENVPPISSSIPVAILQPEIARLASSLLGQPRPSAGGASLSVGEDFRQPNTMHQTEDNYNRPPQKFASQSNQVPSELSSPQFVRREFQTAAQGSQQPQGTSTQDDDADPQKRLQATLQLAAALLQQIQQGKGS